MDFYFADAKPFAAGDYDRGKELGTIAISWDIIEQKGSWYHYGSERWQGKDNVYAQLREDLILQDELLEQINRVVYHVITEAKPEPTRKITRRKK